MNIERLKEIREDRDYKQIDIAKLLKITQAQYSRYEMGINTIPLDKINKLADLLSKTDEKKPYPKSILKKK